MVALAFLGGSLRQIDLSTAVLLKMRDGLKQKVFGCVSSSLVYWVQWDSFSHLFTFGPTVSDLNGIIGDESKHTKSTKT